MDDNQIPLSPDSPDNSFLHLLNNFDESIDYAAFFGISPDSPKPLVSTNSDFAPCWAYGRGGRAPNTNFSISTPRTEDIVVGEQISFHLLPRDVGTDYAVEFETNPPQESTQDHSALPATEDYLRMDDNQIQLSPDDSFPNDLLNLSADNSNLDDVQNLSLNNIFLDDIQKFFDESIDYAVESETNPPQDSTQDHPAMPEEPVEDSIPMDGGVPPLPSTGRDELTTNPKTDSAHHHHIILDPIFETFFKRQDESPGSPTSEDNLSDSVETPKPTPHSTQQHPPPTSQSLEVPVSTSQPLQNISNQQHVHAQLYQPKPTPMQSSTPLNKRQKISSKRCGCKANKCQKRYCKCYAAGELCGDNCSCQGCFNNSEYEATKKRNNNMRHNPQAMYGAPTLNPIAPSSAVNIASMARQQANSFTTSRNISPLPVVLMPAIAPSRANPSTTYQPQQQQMLMNPTNPQQMDHRASSVNSGSRSMQIPPRLRPEADKMNMK